MTKTVAAYQPNAFRMFITRSRAGHYTASVRRKFGSASQTVFKSNKRSTAQAARDEAEAFIAASSQEWAA